MPRSAAKHFLTYTAILALSWALLLAAPAAGQCGPGPAATTRSPVADTASRTPSPPAPTRPRPEAVPATSPVAVSPATRQAGVAPAAGAAAGWRPGRATYFGAPADFGKAFDKARGKGSFGILEYGSCGFTNSDGTLPFPRDAVAAAADASADYPGSCGRCYAIRCRSGPVRAPNGNPVNITTDTFYLPRVSRTLPDTWGRRWPGNPGESAGLLVTQCYDPNKVLVVRIIDTCPCIQVLPDGAPGVAPGGETRRQKMCCQSTAGIQHFDISYWAFEQLAHPLFGLMNLEFKTVDCDTRADVPYGYVNKDVIYGPKGTQAGWSWFPYSASYSEYAIPGRGPTGQAATCVALTAGGGLSFQLKQGSTPGYQPFRGVNSIRLWLRSNTGAGATAAAEEASSTPTGQPVDLKVFIFNDEAKKYCRRELFTGKHTDKPSRPAGPDGWFRHTIPFADFGCDYEGALPNQVYRIDFQNIAADRTAFFCLAELELIR